MLFEGDCDDCLPLKDHVAKLCGLRLGPGPYLESAFTPGGGEGDVDSLAFCEADTSAWPVKLGNS